MSASPEQKALQAVGISDLPALDAWYFSKALCGQPPDLNDRGVSMPNRRLAQTLVQAPVEGREEIWNDHLSTLSEAEREAWIEAVSAVNPDDPAPQDDSWEQPRFFELPPVEPFPLDVYPPSVARFIVQVANSIGCPADFPAVNALAVMGAAIGRSASLKLKGGFFESASVYSLCIGRPGDGKSPALSTVVKPLRRISDEHFNQWQKDLATYERLMDEFDASKRAAKHSRSAHDPEAPEQGADQATAALLKPTRPTLKRIVVGDTTVEALVCRMQENPRGLLMALDEAVTLVTSMNQYKGGKGSDREFFLTTWSGQRHEVDRKTNEGGVPILVPHPFLCITGGMVPDRLSESEPVP